MIRNKAKLQSKDKKNKNEILFGIKLEENSRGDMTPDKQSKFGAHVATMSQTQILTS